MRLYRVVLKDGQYFWMYANMLQAAAGITACFHDPEDIRDWQVTPFQTSDARHDTYRAAHLAAKYFATGPDDCTVVKAVRLVR